MFNVRILLFDMLWRLAIILLPWQTRWFAEASLAGWPWEQARISIYASYLPMLAAIVIAQFLSKQDLAKNLRQVTFYLIAALSFITIVNNLIDIRPVAAWWLQIVILLSFFITLIRANIELKKVLTWFVIALIPHAFLALVQVYIQYVPGYSWLGIATQDPTSLGVSVVQTNGFRYLRAYGGFPHPNILGGFMAFGILISTWLYSDSPSISEKGIKSWKRVFILSTLPLFSAVLFYSFSRSAWLALAIGLSVLLVPSLIRGSKMGIVAFAAILLTNLAFSIIHLDLTSTRLGLNREPARLEQQSISTRNQSLINGIKVFQAYPILGTGPNSEILALTKLNAPFNKEEVEARIGSLEPPHNTWLLMLVNFGVVGALFIFGAVLFLLRQTLKYWSSANKKRRDLMLALITAWIIISIFDYYLWAFWSGQLLTIFTFFILLLWLNTGQKTTQQSKLKNQQIKLDGKSE